MPEYEQQRYVNTTWKCRLVGIFKTDTPVVEITLPDVPNREPISYARDKFLETNKYLLDIECVNKFTGQVVTTDKPRIPPDEYLFRE